LAVASTGPRDRKFRAGWSSGFDHHSCGNVFKSLGYRLVKAMRRVAQARAASRSLIGLN